MAYLRVWDQIINKSINNHSMYSMNTYPIMVFFAFFNVFFWIKNNSAPICPSSPLLPAVLRLPLYRAQIAVQGYLGKAGPSMPFCRIQLNQLLHISPPNFCRCYLDDGKAAPQGLLFGAMSVILSTIFYLNVMQQHFNKVSSSHTRKQRKGGVSEKCALISGSGAWSIN